MTVEGSTSTNLTSLQAGRAIAALLVVLYHATAIFADPKYWHVSILHEAFRFGYAGVEFFFVLSGFIMMHVHYKDFGHTERLPNYFRKRALRIYPLYWLVTLLVLASYVATHNPRLVDAPNSFLLIGRGTDAILTVAWTLFHEVAFYLIFATLFLGRRLGAAALALWFAACLPWFGREAPHYAVSSINLLFGFGIAAAVLYPRILYARLLLALAITAFIAVGLEVVYLRLLSEGWHQIGFGLAAALGIASAVKAELADKLRTSRLLSRLGDSSYALYLVHYPLMVIAAKIWLQTPLAEAPPGVAFAALVAVAVIAGFLLHILIEKPLLRKFRRRPPKASVAAS